MAKRRRRQVAEAEPRTVVQLSIGGKAERKGILTLEFVLRWSDKRRTVQRVRLAYEAGQRGGDLIEQLLGRRAEGAIAYVEDEAGRVLITSGSDADLGEVRRLRGRHVHALGEEEQNQDGLMLMAAPSTSASALAIAVGVGMYGSSRLSEGWIDIEFETPGMRPSAAFALGGGMGTSASRYLDQLLAGTTAAGLGGMIDGNTLRVVVPPGTQVYVTTADYSRATIPMNTGVAVLRNNTGLSKRYYLEVWALSLL